MWAFGRRAGLLGRGWCMATCIGLFLFTRILIPDVMLTAAIALAMWAFLRALGRRGAASALLGVRAGRQPGRRAAAQEPMGVLFPVGGGVDLSGCHAAVVFARGLEAAAPVQRRCAIVLADRRARGTCWRRCAIRRISISRCAALPGQYHGFLWFYFINEQVLRFLNLRYPRDYDTVPRGYTSGCSICSGCFPGASTFRRWRSCRFRPVDRAGQTRLLALCWIGFMLVFFTFSTTQEYYSMPCYPALALLLGSAMAAGGEWIRRGTRVLAGIWPARRRTVAWCWPGGAQHSRARRYLGGAVAASGRVQALAGPHGRPHDCLRSPICGCRCCWRPWHFCSARSARAALGLGTDSAFLAAALMMVVFFQAARMAMVAFDPYLSSRPLAEALLRAPPGKLMVDHHYYTFSSVFFYTNRDRAAAERALQQPGVRLLRARRSGCFHRRCRLEGALAASRALLPGDQGSPAAAPGAPGGPGRFACCRVERRQAAAVESGTGAGGRSRRRC